MGLVNADSTDTNGLKREKYMIFMKYILRYGSSWSYIVFSCVFCCPRERCLGHILTRQEGERGG